MSLDQPAPTSGDELNARLEELFRTAHANDVDVEGGWTCRNAPDNPDWEVVVTELRTDDSA